MDFLPFWGEKGGIEKKRHWGELNFPIDWISIIDAAVWPNNKVSAFWTAPYLLLFVWKNGAYRVLRRYWITWTPLLGKKTSVVDVDDVEPPLPAGLWYTLYRIIDSSSRGMGICWPRHKRTRQERGNEIKGRRKKKVLTQLKNSASFILARGE